MLYEFERSGDGGQELAALTKEIEARVLNCSATGCLVETDAVIAVGTVAVLRVHWNGRELTDTVRVVRCQQIQGAGSVNHLGMQFVSTKPPDAATLRYVIHRGQR
jgi:PilZ domain-containing protein